MLQFRSWTTITSSFIIRKSNQMIRTLLLNYDYAFVYKTSPKYDFIASLQPPSPVVEPQRVTSELNERLALFVEFVHDLSKITLLSLSSIIQYSSQNSVMSLY